MNNPSRLCLALLPFFAPAAAFAGFDGDLLTARDAARANDIPRLENIANTAPRDNPLSLYPAYWLTQKALEVQDDAQITRFLSVAREGVLAERIRRDWLKQLGKREDWTRFAEEWPKLAEEGRDEEAQCYGDVLAMRQGAAPANLNRFLEPRPLGDGCNRLLALALEKGAVTRDWALRRMRLLLSGNYVTQARQLAALADLPLDTGSLGAPLKASPGTPAGQETLLYGIVQKGRDDVNGAAQILSGRQDELTPAQRGFAWGQLALFAARKLNTAQASEWFARADKSQLTRDQWEWWARAELRQDRQEALQTVIRAMPEDIAARPAWQYWLGRSLKRDGKATEANALFARVSAGHHYYGLLALDELGNAASEQGDTARPSEADINRMSKDPSVRRSLALFALAQDRNRADFRGDAQVEWRYAMRNRTDMELLAAADMARKIGFFDMAIYSAERTRKEHDYSLRYLTPYRDITQRFARQLGLDDAWIYGLIRQESRFITIARSGVGASGLMQLMPATARWAARKMGLGDKIAINDIETNIQIGTWYMKYVMDNLSGSAVMATAAYNAGPGRARNWQDVRPLEGAVYAETIPFNETRDYVQKVMANASWYSTGMGREKLSLKTRLGTIPAR
ncbi:lytic transglycosylase domain-containing protein [Paludibacterium paludis]|uniref:Murein transglycosylase n=1 Tax=Paludibacterium paludis TaxID=1225769 RepID=A0A918UBS2_9NEIS|nr:lytic transglycosylase domain-containing protein [Paludibacterium paludis]GGY25461.1 murein transglycosylase [Paludibacterium paludis]